MIHIRNVLQCMELWCSAFMAGDWEAKLAFGLIMLLPLGFGFMLGLLWADCTGRP